MVNITIIFTIFTVFGFGCGNGSIKSNNHETEGEQLTYPLSIRTNLINGFYTIYSLSGIEVARGQGSLARVFQLEAGDYIIHFDLVEGYEQPDEVQVTLPAENEMEIVGNYNPLPEEKEEKEESTICIESILEDNTWVVSGGILIDGEVLCECATICTTIDPNIEHIIAPMDVKGLRSPSPITIPANELERGKIREYKLIYTSMSEERTIFINTVDQFNNSVPGEIYFDGRLAGVGEAEIQYNTVENHLVTFGELDGYTALSDLEIKGNFSNNYMHSARYIRHGEVANVCFRTINEYGYRVDVEINITGISVSSHPHCLAIDTAVNNHVISGYLMGYTSPEKFKIPAGVLKTGESYEFDLVFRPSEFLRNICIKTTPVLGEVFVDGKSIGWSISSEPACIFVNNKVNHEVSFGEVEGHKIPDTILVTSSDISSYRTPTLFGVYDSDELALICVSAYGPWDNTIGALVEVDEGNMLYPTSWRGKDCFAVDPTVEHTVTFLDATEEDYEPPAEPIEIPAGTLQVGEVIEYIGEYIYEREEERNKFDIHLTFKTPYGDPFEAKLLFNNEEMYIGTEFHWTFARRDNFDPIELHFQSVGYLNPPNFLTIDPTILSIDNANYNSEEDRWEWEIVYQKSAPSARVCMQAVNGNGIPIRVSMWFDGFLFKAPYESIEKCAVLPIGMDHILSLGSLEDHVNTRDILIPAGKLEEDEVKIFEVKYIFKTHYANICVITNKIAEVFLNDESFGWTFPPAQACVAINRTRDNTISFGEVDGFTTPVSVIYSANSLDWGVETNIIGDYTSSQ